MSYLLVSSIYDSKMQTRRIDEYFSLALSFILQMSLLYIGTNKWIVALESNIPGRKKDGMVGSFSSMS